MTHQNDHSGSNWDAPWKGDPKARPSTGHSLTQQYQEGIGYDTDVPNEFLLGVRQGEGDPETSNIQYGGHLYSGDPQSRPRPNQNINVFSKPAAETMRERGHVGSASWVEAPWQLQAFADGARDEQDQPYASEQRSGGHYSRPSHARIED